MLYVRNSRGRKCLNIKLYEIRRTELAELQSRYLRDLGRSATKMETAIFCYVTLSMANLLATDFFFQILAQPVFKM